MGRPKSAPLNADIVGLDTFIHVAHYDSLTDDPERDVFRCPDSIKSMVQKVTKAEKLACFYKKEGSGLYIDTKTLEYRPKVKPDFAEIKAAKKADVMLVHAQSTGQRRGTRRFCVVCAESFITTRPTLRSILPTTLSIMTEPCDGASLELGPFEAWQAIGVLKLRRVQMGYRPGGIDDAWLPVAFTRIMKRIL